MGIKPPARASVLLMEVFQKTGVFEHPPTAPRASFAPVFNNLFNNSNRSTTASRVCWTAWRISSFGLEL